MLIHTFKIKYFQYFIHILTCSIGNISAEYFDQIHKIIEKLESDFDVNICSNDYYPIRVNVTAII